MTAMTVDYKGDQAKSLFNARLAGEGAVNNEDGLYTAAAMAVDKIAAVLLIPAYCRIKNLRYLHAAFGADNGLDIGYCRQDTGDGDPDYFASVVDASAAGGGTCHFAPFTTVAPTYLTVKKTDTATATGDIRLVADYVYVGA